jgi:hypothetical protein
MPDEPPFVAVLVLILATILLPRSAGRSNELTGLTVPAVLTVGFVLIPVVGFIAGLLVTGLFVPYHYMIAAVSIVLGIPLVLAFLSRGDRVIGLALFVAMAGFGLFVTTRGITGYVRHDAAYPALAEVRKLIPEQRPDVVVAAPFEFLPFEEENRHDPENSLVYLYDIAKARQVVKVDTLDIIASHLRGMSRARFEPFDAYIAGKRRFYMAVSPDLKAAWLPAYLKKQLRSNLSYVGETSGIEIYQVDLPEAGRP